MLEHAIYSVISPEGCAAILWEDASRAKDAAEVLRITAPDLLKLGVIDGVIPEPPGGAHRNWAAAARAIQSVVAAAFGELVPALARASSSSSATRSSAGWGSSRRPDHRRVSEVVLSLWAP